ncbi:ferric iron uptake transcriptional regulator [Aquaspirillum sp. LM1]|jgi:Fur family ferric uptake transcriptional regulator|uniref:ferric iron uptake transcriptional regulator n=1 Tax=Aquaspirillum sp. LM1 TaxID=1938604 RepID=UPI000983AC34|nr:ferric iron uptake transcriptional regulator [Aquaspirillum sp. LM1]AQR65437.1 ferric iron uptake transcriptional regulator [Aquaspirillum sp. LM1]
MNKASHLKDIGLKATGPRLKILDLFERSSARHLSAEDVYRLLLADEIDIGLATVYRVLTQFEQAGILVRHHFESGKAVYELDEGAHHDHMVCMICGRVTEFFSPEIEELQTRIAEQHNFRIREHSLYLYGECTDCSCAGKTLGKQRL